VQPEGRIPQVHYVHSRSTARNIVLAALESISFNTSDCEKRTARTVKRGSLLIVLGETRLLKRLLPLDDPVSQQRLDEAAGRPNGSLAGLNRRQIEARQVAVAVVPSRSAIDNQVCCPYNEA